MNCRRSRRALRLRLDESLELELELQLEAHLCDCQRCRDFAARTQALEEALVRLPEPPVERLDIERAVRLVREQRVAAEPGVAILHLWPRRVMALAAAAAAGLALWFMLPEREEFTARDKDATTESVAETEQADQERADMEDGRAVVELVEPGQSTDGEQVLPQSAPVPQRLAPLDSERLAAARNEVRTQLAELGATLELDASPEALEAFAELFDLNTLALRRGDWPVRRIVEGALSAEDTIVAGAAARYLGLRGNSSSARHLRRALDREDVAPRAVRALVDLGDPGLESLAYALAQPELREVALRGLVKLGSQQAARSIAAAHEHSGADEFQRDAALLSALEQLGVNGLQPLVDLHARGVIGELQYSSVLGEVADASEWFAAQLQRRDLDEAPSILLGACSLAPAAAAEWLEQNLHESRHRELTRKLLPTLPGSATVASLLRLNDDPRLSSADLSEMTAVALQLDAQRFIDAARAREPGGREGREALIEMLLASGSEAALPVMMVSITDDELPQSARSECALRIAESSDVDALPVLAQVFAACSLTERKLAAACLLGIARIGGDEALASALDGGPRHANQNILSLLQRREAGEEATPSIYKLARELRPFLSARDRETRRTSS